MYSKKEFGQNFLINNAIAEKIVKSLDIKNTDNVLEIGPGKGILTKYIIKKTSNAIFVEIDKNLYDYLQKKYNLGNNIINKDVLKLDINSLFNSQKIKIIGNFPYNISGKLIFKFIENRNIIDTIVGMFQKEVVDRLISKENSKKYGIPTILTGLYYDVKKLFDVEPDNFNPKPKVTSSVCIFKRNDIKKLECDEKLLFEVVKLSFSCRRKTIKNNLKPKNYDTHINPEYLNKRAEMLSINDFINITKEIETKILKPLN